MDEEQEYFGSGGEYGYSGGEDEQVEEPSELENEEQQYGEESYADPGTSAAGDEQPTYGDTTGYSFDGAADDSESYFNDGSNYDPDSQNLTDSTQDAGTSNFDFDGQEEGSSYQDIPNWDDSNFGDGAAASSFDGYSYAGSDDSKNWDQDSSNFAQQFEGYSYSEAGDGSNWGQDTSNFAQPQENFSNTAYSQYDFGTGDGQNDSGQSFVNPDPNDYEAFIAATDGQSNSTDAYDNFALYGQNPDLNDMARGFFENSWEQINAREQDLGEALDLKMFGDSTAEQKDGSTEQPEQPASLDEDYANLPLPNDPEIRSIGINPNLPSPPVAPAGPPSPPELPPRQWDPRRGGYRVPGHPEAGVEGVPEKQLYNYPSEQECKQLSKEEKAHPTPAITKRNAEDNKPIEQTFGTGVGGALGTIVGGLAGSLGGIGGGVIGGLLGLEAVLKGQREEDARNYCREHNGQQAPWTKTPESQQPTNSNKPAS